jgi:hypothetical protein
MNRESKAKARAGAALGAGVLGAAASLYLLGRAKKRWNATRDEAAAPMPMDGEVVNPTYVTNRAITIRALPEQVWPWLAQMGELPRGGFYSYVAVERLLGMKIRNSEDVLPEFQTPQVGEALDRAGNMLVKAVERNRNLVLGPRPTPNLAVTWALALHPSDGGTRLVSRCRARLPRGFRGRLANAILGPGQLLMERRMLLEIRKRAEKLAARSHFAILPERRAG